MTAITLNQLPVAENHRASATVAKDAASTVPANPSKLSGPASSEQSAATMRAFFKAVLPPLLGMLLLVVVWHLATLKGSSIPGPGKTWDAAAKVPPADPWQIAGSTERCNCRCRPAWRESQPTCAPRPTATSDGHVVPNRLDRCWLALVVEVPCVHSWSVSSRPP